MNAEVEKAINTLSKKINSIERKLDEYTVMLHQKNADEINVSEGGMMDIANIVSSHEEAIADLADIVSTLSDTTTV